MRKRILAAVLCAALLVVLGLGQPEKASGESYDIYFLQADLQAAPGADALRAERLSVGEGEAPDTLSLARLLIEKLLAGPEDPALAEVVPAETELLSLRLAGNRANVDLSSRYRLLSGVALSLADCAITLTLTQLPEISSVSITVRGEPLAYRDRQVFTAEDVLFASNEDVVDDVTVTLFLLDEGGALSSRTLTLDLYEGDTQTGAVVRALGEEWEGEGLRSPLPEGFRTTSVRLEESTCYVDLPASALSTMGEEPALSLALEALADSLLSLRAVTEVRYLVDGEYASLYGGVPVMEPYTADP